MSSEVFLNNYLTTVTAPIALGDTTITVASTPSGTGTSQFRIMIDSEIMLVTVASLTTLTCVGGLSGRGMETTAVATHSNTAVCESILTAGSLQAVVAELSLPDTFTSAITMQSTLGVTGATTLAGLTAGVTSLGATTATSFAGPLTGAVTGNASTATALQTGRTINGVTFDGTANITVPAAAGTLTGATLAAGVTGSSLTSVGVLASPHFTSPVVDSGGLTVTAGGASITGAVSATSLLINGASMNLGGRTAVLGIRGGQGGSATTIGLEYGGQIMWLNSGATLYGASGPYLRSNTVTDKFDIGNTASGISFQVDTGTERFLLTNVAANFSVPVQPSADNTYALGTSSFRWSDVRANTATLGAVTVNGTLGVQSAPSTAVGLTLNAALTGATVQRGITLGNITTDSGATNYIEGVYVGITTAAATYTTANLNGFDFGGVSKGAGHTITNMGGYITTDFNATATNTVGFLYGAMPSGHWAFYSNSTVASYLGGALTINSGGLTVSAGGATITGNSFFANPVGIGAGGAGTDRLLNVAGSGTTTGVTQYGIVVTPQTTSAATSAGIAGYFQITTPAAAFTMTGAYGIQIQDAVKGAGSTITNQFGLYVNSQTQGVTNYAIYTNTGPVSLGDALTVRSGGLTVTAGSGTFNTGAAGTIGLIVQGFAGQTANLQEWRRPGDGVAMVTVAVSGNIFTYGTVSAASISTTGTTSLAGLTMSGLSATTSTAISLVDNGGTGPSIQKITGTALGFKDQYGTVNYTFGMTNDNNALTVNSTVTGKLLDLQASSVSKFSVTAAGAATVANGLTVTAGASVFTGGIGADLLPSVNAVYGGAAGYSLGSTTFRWNSLRISDGAIYIYNGVTDASTSAIYQQNGDLRISSNSQFMYFGTLGSNANVVIDSSVTALYPSTDNGFALGTATKRWSGLVVAGQITHSNSAPAYAATITPTGGVEVQSTTLTGAVAVAAPTTSTQGTYMTFIWTQDATGGRVVTYNAVYKTGGAATFVTTLSTVTIDVFYCVDGTNWRLVSRITGQT